jgi:glycerate-2-kinase
MRKSLKFDEESKELIINDESFDLSNGRIFVVGGGKAAGQMAETFEKIIPPLFITAGVVNCTNSDYKTEKIKVNTAAHPIPDQQGVAGVQQMLELKNDFLINERDFIICLISGGGSALMPMPVNEITLEDKQKVTDQLMNSGAEIKEINTVRTKLSRIKGGKLGKYFSPATVISLIISDVVGNFISAIASGPTVEDNTTYNDAINILMNNNLLNTVPPNLLKFLKDNQENDKTPINLPLKNCNNFIMADNKLALEAMSARARELGYKPKIVTSKLKGDPNKLAHGIAQEIQTGVFKDHNVLLFGGETTPRITGHHGRGGRNQQFAAVSLLEFKNYSSDWLIASVSTDGSDFIPGVAGALVDRSTTKTIEKNDINLKKYVQDFDSYNLFKTLEDSLILTDNTGTNVGDLIIFILK